MNRRKYLTNMFALMLDELGPSHWWPARSRFEMTLGAILTQNTNWGNVEKALGNLRERAELTPASLLSLTGDGLAELIRPAGYFRLKAKRLGNFLEFLRREATGPELARDDLAFLAGQETEILREKLLMVSGIGPETADSILLYAFNRPVFVVDAYTARILSRHMLLPEEADYSEVQAVFDVLPADEAMFNEFHALIVRTAKNWCGKKRALCGECPLSPLLE